jgi:hypothetical protein
MSLLELIGVGLFLCFGFSAWQNRHDRFVMPPEECPLEPEGVRHVVPVEEDEFLYRQKFLASLVKVPNP